MLEISRITVQTRPSAMDIVILHTNLPGTTYPFKGNAEFITYCSQSTGMEWVKKNFPGIYVELKPLL